MSRVQGSSEHPRSTADIRRSLRSTAFDGVRRPRSRKTRVSRGSRFASNVFVALCRSRRARSIQNSSFARRREAIWAVLGSRTTSQDLKRGLAPTSQRRGQSRCPLFSRRPARCDVSRDRGAAGSGMTKLISTTTEASRDTCLWREGRLDVKSVWSRSFRASAGQLGAVADGH